MVRSVCTESSCPAHAWGDGDKCSKHSGDTSVRRCENDGCDNPRYLDGECITCQFPL